jgi:hypothetical protein
MKQNYPSIARKWVKCWKLSMYQSRHISSAFYLAINMLKFCFQLHFGQKTKTLWNSSQKVKHTADTNCVALYIKSPTPPIWSFRHEEDSIGHVTLHHRACSSSWTIKQSFFSVPAWPWSWRHHNPSKCPELLTQCHSVTHQKNLNLPNHHCENLKSHAF